MPRRRSSSRRSATDWGIRALLAATAATLGYYSISYSLAATLKAKPELAHALGPSDGRITARLAQRLLTSRPNATDHPHAERQARLALNQDPTAVPAVTTLGLAAQLKGDVQKARHLFGYAQKLSRRDLETHLWAIEDAVSRDDISGALRHYDMALRTSRNAPDVLFPVLASAIGDPAIRSALIKTMANKPLWSASFIDFSVGHSPGPLATAQFFAGLRRVGVPVVDEASAMAVSGLLAGNRFDEAWSYYRSIRPGADRRMSRDRHFMAQISYPAPFDWTLINDAGISTSIQQGQSSGIFDFSVSASLGGTVLQQMQMLLPGSYRLEGHSTGIEQPERSRPYWVLSCADGREFGRVRMRNSSQANGAFGGELSVPSGCPLQMLSLVVPSSDSVSAITGQIDDIRLYPVR